MLIIHSVQKLLNTSRLEGFLYITQPNENQLLHCWYARLLASGSPGKMLVMYVHEPSLMAVICKGKTIQGTWEPFLQRLKALLARHQFPEAFIKNEMAQAEGYTVSKTNSRSLLSFMNQMAFELEDECRKAGSYESIALDDLEDRMIDRVYQFGQRVRDHRTPIDYWKQEIGLNS